MEGQLSKHPLAELIREIIAAALSGALRVERERAKVAVYFENGQLIFAASNLRAHRLREILEHGGLNAAQMSDLRAKASDEELANTLIESGRVTAEKLAAIRSKQVSDVLRVALLWTNGKWEFDPRVRLAGDVRVPVDVQRLLLECARHLPASFVGSRFSETNGVTYQAAFTNDTTSLLPAESAVLARASASVRLSELRALNGATTEDNLRAVYALSLSGLLERGDWPTVFDGVSPTVLHKRSRASSALPKSIEAAAKEADEAGDVEALFARLKTAKSHYDVLDLARLADAAEIKGAYHSLARRFHPDHFHKSDSALRNRVDSAFARIAQAYETLSHSALRAAYDTKLASKSVDAGAKTTGAEKPVAEGKEKTPNAERAETSFQQGLAALKRSARDQAIRLFAEAAMLQPREARYRANYGYALIGETNARRVAESELQAAISLEPNNTAHRVMLAEFYQKMGLRRRAQGEVERALAADPQNKAAQALLASLKSNA